MFLCIISTVSFIFHDPRDFKRAAGAVRRVFLDNTNQCNNFTKTFYPCGMLLSVPVPIEQVCDDFKDGGCGKFDRAKVKINYLLHCNVVKTRKCCSRKNIVAVSFF